MSNPDTTRIFNYPEVTTPASDAKILLDSQTVGSKCIDANLFHCDLIDKTITQRGTFEASEDDADGFKKVVVDIPYTDVHVASGPIATFEGEDLPLKSLTASIVPVQAGSGDPSPTNVRPISGWSSVNVVRHKKNFVDISKLGLYVATSTSGERVGVPVYLPQGTYTISKESGDVVLYLTNIDDDYSFQQITLPFTFTVETSAHYLIRISTDTLSSWDITNLQVEKGSTPTTYEPYNGTTTTIPFTDGQGQSVEVFGGSVDIVNGVVTPCPYYASYNGEELTGEWMSDRDVYSPNTSPTIGAQVVNIGTTGTPFSTQPTSIKSLDGVNNVWADTGDVDVEYQTVWVRPSE